MHFKTTGNSATTRMQSMQEKKKIYIKVLSFEHGSMKSFTPLCAVDLPPVNLVISGLNSLFCCVPDEKAWRIAVGCRAIKQRWLHHEERKRERERPPAVVIDIVNLAHICSRAICLELRLYALLFTCYWMNESTCQ